MLGSSCFVSLDSSDVAVGGGTAACSDQLPSAAVPFPGSGSSVKLRRLRCGLAAKLASGLAAPRELKKLTAALCAPRAEDAAAEMWQSVGLTLLVIVATLVCALLFMLFGWYVVWQLFLSKFKFLRELVGDAGTPQAENEPSESKMDRASGGPTRSRNRAARQKLASPESTS
ncbi:hypothetical protein OJAV_G00109430 [Oryzias javanicus]|uniref:Small integral membrane protein 13 n=1 Tax=Oryzias javanicus TaxID=123683 RepID=A0A437CUP4_ORYJA|nr:hypothetical protein OJAV_G00109430 [Oryzias javanicus]